MPPRIFDQYIIEPVQDRDVVTKLLWKANRTSYVIYRAIGLPLPLILSNSSLIQTTPFYKLCVTFHIFGLGESRDFQFYTQVDRGWLPYGWQTTQKGGGRE